MNRPLILRSVAIAAVLALAAVGLERAVATLGTPRACAVRVGSASSLSPPEGG